MSYDPFVYDYTADDFFEDDYDSELDRSHLINKWAESNYQTAISHGVDPLTAMDWGTDVAVVWAKFAIDPGYEPSQTERDHLERFWTLFS